MQSLEARKKQRAASRAESLKDSPNQDTGIVQDGVTNDGKSYADMTIEELQAAAREMGQEVPKEKKLRPDILEYVENLAKVKAAEAAEKSESAEGNGANAAGWKSGN